MALATSQARRERASVLALPPAPDRSRAAGDRQRAAAPRSWGGRLLRVLVMLVAAGATLAFGVLLVRLTLTPLPKSSPYIYDNTHPGETLRRYLDRPSIRTAVYEIGGNFVLFMPFGALLPVAVRWLSGLLRTVLVVLVLSLLIEVAQGTLVTGRSFDADDVILNTSGALLAYLLVGRPLARWSHRAA
jgi:hypothetical protein